jgi:hypothetical protein
MMKNFKLRYTTNPACISFGPLFMTNIGETIGRNEGWSWLPLAGSLMVAAGLGMMLGILIEQQQVINRLLSEQPREPSVHT